MGALAGAVSVAEITGVGVEILASGVVVARAPVNTLGVTAASVCGKVGILVGVLPGRIVGEGVMVGRGVAKAMNGKFKRSS